MAKRHTAAGISAALLIAVAASTWRQGADRPVEAEEAWPSDYRGPSRAFSQLSGGGIFVRGGGGGGGGGSGGVSRPTPADALEPVMRAQEELRMGSRGDARETMLRWGIPLPRALSRAALSQAAVSRKASGGGGAEVASAAADPSDPMRRPPSRAAASGSAAAATSSLATAQTPALPSPGAAARSMTTTAGSSYLDAIWGHRGQGEMNVPYEGEKGTMLRMLESHPVEAERQRTGTAMMPSPAEIGLERAGAIKLEDPTQIGDATIAARIGAMQGERRRAEPNKGLRTVGGVNAIPDVTQDGYFGAVWGRRNVGGGAQTPYAQGYGVRLRSLSDGERAEREREAMRGGWQPGLVAARGAEQWGDRGGLRDRTSDQRWNGGRIMGGLSYLHEVFHGAWRGVRGAFHLHE